MESRLEHHDILMQRNRCMNSKHLKNKAYLISMIQIGETHFHENNEFFRFSDFGMMQSKFHNHAQFPFLHHTS